MKKLALLLMLFGANCLTIGCTQSTSTEEPATTDSTQPTEEGAMTPPAEEAPAE